MEDHYQLLETALLYHHPLINYNVWLFLIVYLSYELKLVGVLLQVFFILETSKLYFV